jgi:hypothetical protein
LQSRAEAKGLDFDLELQDIRALFERKRCYYTGVIFSSLRSPDGGELPWNMRTLDRMDVNGGYTKDNVVACIHEFNQLKGYLESSPLNITPEQMVRGLRKVADIEEKLY